MIDVVVDNRVRIPLAQVEDLGIAKLLREEFTHPNPKRDQLRRARVRGWWAEPEVIATHEERDGVISLPRGGMSKVRRIIQGVGETFRVFDRRVRGHRTLIPDSSVKLWPHQDRIVAAGLRRENCIVKSSTGSGKTTALIALASRIKVDTLVIVHANALMYQWVKRAHAELGIPASDVGVIGDGKHRICELTVGTMKSVANAARDPEFLQRWGAVLVDEVHLFAARTFFACVDPFPARYRIGVSDDERRKDKLEFLIYDLFGDVEEEVSHEEMVQAGHVLDVEVCIVPTDFEAPWFDAERESKKKSPDYTRLHSEMAADEKRNELVRAILSRELRDGRQCLVFTREREHARAIAAPLAEFGTGYLLGGAGANRVEFERTSEGLRSGELRVACGTLQACGTGVDLPGVEIGLSALPILTNRQAFRQARGRLCRKPEGKSLARFYVLFDRNVFGISHLENAASWNGKNTFIWDGGEWVQVREWLKRVRVKGGGSDG